GKRVDLPHHRPQRVLHHLFTVRLIPGDAATPSRHTRPRAPPPPSAQRDGAPRPAAGRDRQVASYPCPVRGRHLRYVSTLRMCQRSFRLISSSSYRVAVSCSVVRRRSGLFRTNPIGHALISTTS